MKIFPEILLELVQIVLRLTVLHAVSVLVTHSCETEGQDSISL